MQNVAKLALHCNTMKNAHLYSTAMMYELEVYE